MKGNPRSNVLKNARIWHSCAHIPTPPSWLFHRQLERGMPYVRLPLIVNGIPHKPTRGEVGQWMQNLTSAQVIIKLIAIYILHTRAHHTSHHIPHRKSHRTADPLTPRRAPHTSPSPKHGTRHPAPNTPRTTYRLMFGTLPPQGDQRKFKS